jgi:hypothetical protein
MPSSVKSRLDIQERITGDDFIFSIIFDKASEKESRCFGLKTRPKAMLIRAEPVISRS